jgi:hypothetical protein
MSSDGHRSPLERFEAERTELERRLRRGLDDDRLEHALELQERYEALADPGARVELLDRLAVEDPSGLAGLAWVLDEARELERFTHSHLLDLIGERSFRLALEEVAADERTDGIEIGELVSWARIRWAGGADQYERVIQRREAR